MKKAMFTAMDDRFAVGFEPFWCSFIERNEWFKFDFLILDLGIDDHSKRIIKKCCKFAKFVKPKYDNYVDVNMSRTDPKLQQTYYKLDIFCQYDYDLLVMVDLDMIVLGDLSELFNQYEEFSACAAYRPNVDALERKINSGLFVITNLSQDKYNDILKLAQCGHKMPDQQVVNDYFEGNINYLDKMYNVEKRMLKSEKIAPDIKDVKILHYIGAKPWEVTTRSEYEQGYEELENIWWKYYLKMETFNA